MEEKQYISMKRAAEILQIKRPSLYYYVGILKFEIHRFQLDKEAYLELPDFELIKKLKGEAQRRSETKVST